jgi:hypothetical protein
MLGIDSPAKFWHPPRPWLEGWRNIPIPLVLNLQVSASAPFSGGCVQGFSLPAAVSPVFDLTPMVIATQPTNSANGKALGLEGAMSIHRRDRQAGFTVTSLYGYFNGQSSDLAGKH